MSGPNWSVLAQQVFKAYRHLEAGGHKEPGDVTALGRLADALVMISNIEWVARRWEAGYCANPNRPFRDSLFEERKAALLACSKELLLALNCDRADDAAPRPSLGTALARAQAFLARVSTMLAEKNARYGDSAANPVRVFSHADSVEQIKVRIDDKLSRVARGKGPEDEDVILDLVGYFALLVAVSGPIADEKMS